MCKVNLPMMTAPVEPMVWIGSLCGHVEHATGTAAGYYAGDTEPCVHCGNQECVATLTVPPPGWLDRMFSEARSALASLATVEPLTMTAVEERALRCHASELGSQELRAALHEVDALRKRVESFRSAIYSVVQTQKEFREEAGDALLGKLAWVPVWELACESLDHLKEVAEFDDA